MYKGTNYYSERRLECRPKIADWAGGADEVSWKTDVMNGAISVDVVCVYTDIRQGLDDKPAIIGYWHADFNKAWVWKPVDGATNDGIFTTFQAAVVDDPKEAGATTAARIKGMIEKITHGEFTLDTRKLAYPMPPGNASDTGYDIWHRSWTRELPDDWPRR